MLRDFFYLNDLTTVRQYKAEELGEHFRNASSLENADLGEQRFGEGSAKTWKSVFENKTFRNVRFSHSVFTRITFKGCAFEDCLFIGTKFIDCEFHRTRFVNCNTYKFALESVYIDPAVVRLDPSYKKTASNVGVDLYHELYRNSINGRQDRFARAADIRMERWKRAQLHYDLKAQKITSLEYYWQWWRNILSDIFLCFGYGWLNFFVAGLMFFALLALVMQWTWDDLGLKAGTTIVSAPRYIDMFYYSMLLITTLGFTDNIPTTTYGRLFAVGFAVIGVVWAGILTSLLVRRLIR